MRAEIIYRFSLAFLGALLILQTGVQSAPLDSSNLLADIRTAGIGKLEMNSATVYDDSRSGCMTITFHFVHGDPEIKVPSQKIGWPVVWSDFRSIAFTLQSTTVEPLYVDFYGGKTKKTVVIEPLEGIRVRGAIPFGSNPRHEERDPTGLLGYKLWPEKLDVPERVTEIAFRMHAPSQPAQFTFCDFRLTKAVPVSGIIDRHPLLDRFGQWILETWDRKAYADADLAKFWNEENLQPVEFPYCQLGGDPSQKLKASGFFRTDKIGNRWVLVDPHGHPFYSAGMDIVDVANPSFATGVSGRQFLFEELPPAGPAWLKPNSVVSFYAANLIRRDGGDWKEKGNQRMALRLRNWGFNTIGNWSDRDFAGRSGMPYVLPIDGWYTKKIFDYPYGLPDIFSDEFKRNVDEAARAQATPLKNDPNLIGWFLDNEPSWAQDFELKKSWADTVLNDPEPSATKTKLQALIAADPKNAASVKQSFLYECMKAYLETVTAAVRKYDPNHLILGVRFAGKPGPQWIKLSSMFDVLSVNVYSDTFAPDFKTIQAYSEGSGRPVLIGEFTAATPGRGLQGMFYGSFKVANHAERGVAYRYFVENSVANPYIVGTHWFQLVDDAPTGRPGDGERLNYGFVNVLDLPYPDLVESARQTHMRLYSLMFGRVAPVETRPMIN